jgi:hypothetical protein
LSCRKAIGATQRPSANSVFALQNGSIAILTHYDGRLIIMPIL